MYCTASQSQVIQIKFILAIDLRVWRSITGGNSVTQWLLIRRNHISCTNSYLLRYLFGTIAIYKLEQTPFKKHGLSGFYGGRGRSWGKCSGLAETGACAPVSLYTEYSQTTLFTYILQVGMN